METALKIDTGDTAWILVSTALVLLMTPGLAFFYGGMVRTKNVLSTIMHSLFAMGLVTLVWVTVGYTLAFGSDKGGVIGGWEHLFLAGVGLDPKEGMTIPHALFMAFQMMFAIITPALISGAYAERLKFRAYVLFSTLWLLLVYAPSAHWVWGGGFLAGMGALDFAGGTVVHINAGISALVFAMVLGPRKGFPRDKHIPHNLTMTVLGTGLLWFGWFGFNAGSALAANGLAAIALVNTHVAAGTGAVAWTVVEALRFGKANAFGFASGLVAGLVAITPAAGYVSPMASVMIGLCAGVVCYGAVILKEKLGYDDSLDAFGVHGVGGILGALLTGVFAEKVWNAAGNDGLLAGNPGLLWTQAVATFVSMAYSAVATFLIVKLVEKTVGLRVSEEVEYDGLDVNLHGEQGYAMGPTAQAHSILAPGGTALAAEEAAAVRAGS
ncbi:MAG: ammonium transporter [Myxococcales bacterium]|nr:ammonium transporter [Myxococcales bacterium]